MSYIRPISDPFLIRQSTQPMQSQVNIVEDLERDLRSDKKQEVKDMQSQIISGSAAASSKSPDTGLPNKEIIDQVSEFVQQDNVPPNHSTASVLGDFSWLLSQQSEMDTMSGGIARNQLSSMAFSTIHNEQGFEGSASRIIESQMNYNLAAAPFGLAAMEAKSIAKAKKYSRIENNIRHY